MKKKNMWKIDSYNIAVRCTGVYCWKDDISFRNLDFIFFFFSSIFFSQIWIVASEESREI